MAVPYTFATQTTSIPLAQLDTNFSTPITIGTTVIPLGNVAPILENVILGNVVIATGNVTLTNISVINATITKATITTANVATANITIAYITTANIATANVSAMEAVSANVTTLRSTTINVTTANVTTLIATGNTILGDATTDTLTVGVTGIVKDASGNVGIGTVPSYKLDMSGTSVGSAVWAHIVNTDTTAGASSGYFASNGAVNVAMYCSSAAGYGILGTTTNHPVTLFTNNTERMRIDSSGNVGIGTSSPLTTLEVRGTPDTNWGNTVLFDNRTVAINQGGMIAFGGYKTGTSAQATFAQIQGAKENATSANEAGYLSFSTNSNAAYVERMRIDSVGNAYVETGNLWQYSPAPTALAAGANAGTAAQLRSGMFSAAQTTAVTLTMPTGTAIDTGFAGVPAVDIGFYFYVINTGSALGAVTVAVNTNVTSLGSLVVAIGTSAQFRLRRTAANTYIMYRLS